MNVILLLNQRAFYIVKSWKYFIFQSANFQELAFISEALQKKLRKEIKECIMLSDNCPLYATVNNMVYQLDE